MTSPASLTKLGFRLGRGGVHAARTMMFEDLSRLFEHAGADATRDDYRRAVVARNVLGKPTHKARVLAFGHLMELYGLDPAIPLFRAFRRLWDTEAAARPRLALMVALARDPLLRLSKAFILSKAAGETVRREEIEDLLARQDPDRFSPASRQSFAQNINGTWTQAGYLSGRTRKIRVVPAITPAVMTFALFLGHLEGLSGQRLFASSWMRLLPGSPADLETLARAAAQRELIGFLKAGGVMDVRFPGYLTDEEEQWRHG